MKRLVGHFKTYRNIFLIGLVIIIIAGFIFWPRSPEVIETQTVKKTTITSSLSATGCVNAHSSANLTFLAGGKLVYLGIKKGDHVKKGQVIAVLDQRSMQKTLEDDLRDYSKQRNKFDQVKDDNQNRTPQGALNDTMKRILEDNQYDLEKAVISVELQALAKEQSVLTSPIDGIVTRADVTATGVNISATTSFGIVDPTTVDFEIDIDEADIGKVKAGQMVSVSLDAYPDQKIPLTVTAIDFTTHETSTGGDAYTVTVELPTNDNLAYRIGMNGDAEIILNEKNDVLSIPLSSISDDGFVYIKNNEDFEKRKIKTGLQNDTEAEVLSGVEENEEVALDPVAAENMIKNKKKFFFF